MRERWANLRRRSRWARDPAAFLLLGYIIGTSRWWFGTGVTIVTLALWVRVVYREAHPKPWKWNPQTTVTVAPGVFYASDKGKTILVGSQRMTIEEVENAHLAKITVSAAPVRWWQRWRRR